VAFFAVLAVFPGIAAIVGLYSLFAGPRLGDVLQGALPSVLPDHAVRVVSRQIRYMVTNGASDAEQLGVASVFGAATLTGLIAPTVADIAEGLAVPNAAVGLALAAALANVGSLLITAALPYRRRSPQRQSGAAVGGGASYGRA